VRLEASTMALYVTIVLLATTSLLADHETEDIGVLAVLWGESLGLAVAHCFAFVVALHLVQGTRDAHDWETARDQLAGALSVAAICTMTVVLFPTSAELDAVRFTLALILGGAGFEASRANGASRARAFVVGAVVLAAGLAVTLFKNLVTGH
jgi:hypothetical protein